MNHRSLSILIALVGCGSSSGMSAKSQPRTVCSECQSVATYASIDLDSGWTGECWETYEKGGGDRPCTESPIPTPGSECREFKHPCKKVEHDVTVRCADNRCRVGTPAPWTPNGYEFTLEQTRSVVVTRGGSFTMDVEFKPKSGGSPRVEHVPVTATTPDGVKAVCRNEATGDFEIELLAGETALGGRYTELAVSLAGAPCTRLPDPASRSKNYYRCAAPIKDATIEVRQPDFSKTIAVTCS